MFKAPEIQNGDTAAKYLKRNHDELMQRAVAAKAVLLALGFTSGNITEDARFQWEMIISTAQRRWRNPETIRKALTRFGGQGLVPEGYGVPRDHGY